MSKRELYDPFKDEDLIHGEGDHAPLPPEPAPDYDTPYIHPSQRQPANDTGPAHDAAPLKRKRKRYNWALAAELLARGEEPASIAAKIGCDTEKLWRHVGKSGRFRARMEKEVERRRLLLSLRRESLALDAAAELQARCSEFDAASLREMMAANDSAPPLRLGSAADKRETEEPVFEARLKQAGKPARPYLTEARRRQMEAVRKAMNGQMAALRVQRDAALGPAADGPRRE